MQISIVCNLINKSFFRSSRVENSKLQKFQKLCFINAILKMNNNNTKKKYGKIKLRFIFHTPFYV